MACTALQAGWAVVFDHDHHPYADAVVTTKERGAVEPSRSRLSVYPRIVGTMPSSLAYWNEALHAADSGCIVKGAIFGHPTIIGISTGQPVYAGRHGDIVGKGVGKTLADMRGATDAGEEMRLQKTWDPKGRRDKDDAKGRSRADEKVLPAISEHADEPFHVGSRANLRFDTRRVSGR